MMVAGLLGRSSSPVQLPRASHFRRHEINADDNYSNAGLAYRLQKEPHTTWHIRQTDPTAPNAPPRILSDCQRCAPLTPGVTILLTRLAQIFLEYMLGVDEWYKRRDEAMFPDQPFVWASVRPLCSSYLPIKLSSCRAIESLMVYMETSTLAGPTF